MLKEFKYIGVCVCVIIIVYFSVRSLELEGFDDFAKVETQERAGPMNLMDRLRRREFQKEFQLFQTYFANFHRFHIELFAEKDFQKKITELKDATETFVSVAINRPIKSIRIRSIPNDNWRFVQFFSFVLYLKHDPTRRIVFHVPRNAESIQYEIPDTCERRQALDWLSNYDTKIAYFHTNFYKPMDDLYHESFFTRKFLVPPKATIEHRTSLPLKVNAIVNGDGLDSFEEKSENVLPGDFVWKRG